MNTQVHEPVRLSQRAQWSDCQPIGELMARALANPELISLAAGFVDQATLPVAEMSEAAESLFAEPSAARAALQYGHTHGDAALRTWILERLRQDDGQPYPDLDIDRVVLTAGSNQMLHLLAETLLDAGDIVLCSSPTYLVFMGILRGMGANSVGVATDEQGIVPESLDRHLSELDQNGTLHRVKAIYLVSYFDNPCGISTSVERREQIVQLAKKWSDDINTIHVIEDAAYRELNYRGDDVPSARSYDPEGDTVIHTGSFSKSFSPGLRIGWGVLPAHLVTPICNQKGNIDFGSPHLNQQLMARVVASGRFDSHAQQVRDGYVKKMDAMLRAADKYLAPLAGVTWNEPHGGLYVWVTVPPSIDTGPSGELFDVAVNEGVLYVPGQFCFSTHGEPIQHNTMRLSFGVQDEAAIDKGMQALARAIKIVMP